MNKYVVLLEGSWQIQRKSNKIDSIKIVQFRSTLQLTGMYTIKRKLFYIDSKGKQYLLFGKAVPTSH